MHVSQSEHIPKGPFPSLDSYYVRDSLFSGKGNSQISQKFAVNFKSIKVYVDLKKIFSIKISITFP